MKTQIENLINGEKRTIRIENHKKYLTAKPSTSHVGYAGTNRDERAEVAAKVSEENPDNMEIVLLGEHITLKRGWSLSKKTWWWVADLTEEQAKKFVNDDGILKSYDLLIFKDCTVVVNKYVRKSERAEWRHSLRQPIDEAYITIL